MMKTLLFFMICLIKGHMSDAAVSMTVIRGGSVVINLKYTEAMTEESAKSFCKISDDKCTTITEEKKYLWIPDERVSLTDNKGFISVLIRNLSIDDSGTYRCEDNGKSFREVKLNVEQDPCCGTSEVQTAYLRGTAVIRCKYPEKNENDLKELFRVQNGSLQPYIASESNQRFSLDPSEPGNVFTVTIADVSRDDEGLYFCGAFVQNKPTEIKNCLLFTEIQLQVSETTMENQEQTDASDLHIIIIVCVCLVLLLAGGLSVLLLKRRCKKTKKDTASSDLRSTGEDAEVVSSAYYAAIPDSSVQKAIRLNTVYDTAHLPTNPSDSDFYTLAE